MFEPIKYMGRFAIAVLDTSNQRRLDRKWNKIVIKTPLLDDVEITDYTIASLNEINKARSRCHTLSHIWSLAQYSSTFPPTYVAECLRCYPHEDSRFTLLTNHLFDEG